MNEISEKAVEVAAKAAWESRQYRGNWESGTTETERAEFRNNVRAALTAALPHLMGEVVGWYVVRVAPGMRDDGTRLGPWFNKSEAEEWCGPCHELRPLYAPTNQERGNG